MMIKKKKNDNPFTGRLKRKRTLSLLERVTRKGGDPITKRNNGLGNWFEILIRCRSVDEAEGSTKAARLKIARVPELALLQRADLRGSRTTVSKFKETIRWSRRHDTPTLPLRLFAVTSLPSFFKRIFFTFLQFSSFVHANFFLRKDERREMKRSVCWFI